MFAPEESCRPALVVTDQAKSSRLLARMLTALFVTEKERSKVTPYIVPIRMQKVILHPFFLLILLICGKITIIMAKKNNTKRKLVGLVSEESGVRAYYTKKNTMNTPDKLSLRKYDPALRKHVVFTETKKNLGRNEVKEKKR